MKTNIRPHSGRNRTRNPRSRKQKHYNLRKQAIQKKKTHDKSKSIKLKVTYKCLKRYVTNHQSKY